MCMAEWCDEFYVTLSNANYKATKVYKCDECYRQIEKGEHYHRFVGVLPSERRVDTWRICPHCVAVRSWIEVQCGNWVFGGLYEDLESHWQEELLLRSLYLGRAILGMRRRWRRGDQLMAVPERFEGARA